MTPKRPRGYTDRYYRERGLILLGASEAAARCAADTFELYKKLKRALLKRKGQIRTAAVSSDLIRPARPSAGLIFCAGPRVV